ncbi:MAG: DUF4124 domain-containing protein [Pseudomonadota bacterium]
MNMMTKLACASALMLFASVAQAQYVWIDEKGFKQFSDRAPPPNTPLNKILKQPGGVPAQVATDDAGASASASATASAPKGPPTLAERNADYKKRQKENAEKAEKAEQEVQAARDKQENCNAARMSKQQLESGMRIASNDKYGNRAFVTDAERQQQLERTNKVLAGCQ